jgi:hypothetical protein
MAILPSFKTVVITCQPGLYYNTRLFEAVRRGVVLDYKEESACGKIENLSSGKVYYQKKTIKKTVANTRRFNTEL